MVIRIDEFSTGINVQGTANNWCSVGFTGYMNCTINPIPPVVQNAISNQLFAVSEGDATDTPAMVGREVEENGEAWSVLAVVSRANDEKGRGISVYRYFLTQGKGKLEDLVRWYSQSGGLKFNPFDSKTLNQYREYTPLTVTNTDLLGKDEFKELLRKEGTDTIIAPNDLVCPPLIINELALRLQVKRYLLEYYKSKNYQLTEAEVKELISYQLTQLSSDKKKDYTQRHFKKSMEAGQLTLSMYEAENFFDYQANQIYSQLSEIERDKRILDSLIDYYEQTNPNKTERQIDFWAKADLNKLTNSMKRDRLVDHEKKQLKKQYTFNNNQIAKDVDVFAEYKTANSNEQELTEFASQFLFEHYKGNGFKLSENYIMLLIESRIINHEYIRNIASQILTNCTIAWGYNVKGLTKPASFQAIFPVSEESRNILGQNVKEGLSLPAPVAGEYPIITASRNMIFQGNVKPDYIDTLEKAFSNPLYTPKFWEDSVFKPLGLENAQKDTTYSPGSLRLLMLRALTVPETLTDFISGIKAKSQDKQIENSLAVANQLSETLKNQLPKDSATIKQAKQGIDTILVGSNAQALQDLVDWIDRDSKGLWGKAYQEYCIDFWQDMEQIAENYKIAKDDAHSKGWWNHESHVSTTLKNRGYYVSHASHNLEVLIQKQWKLLHDDIIELIWTFKEKSKLITLRNPGLCSRLADFFAAMSYQKQLESKSLAATRNLALLFTGLTNSKGIPAKLWEKSLPNLKSSDKRTEILKSKDSNVQILEIRKIPSIKDHAIDWIKGFIEPNPQPQPLPLRLLPIVISLALGTLLGTLLGIILEKQAKISSILTPAPISNEKETFKNTTATTLDKIAEDFKKPLNTVGKKSKKEIEAIFIKANSGENLDYDTKNNDYKAWINSIKKYQSNAKLKSDGIIEKDKDTEKRIRCELYQESNLSAPKATAENCQSFNITVQQKEDELQPTPSPAPTQWQTNVNSLKALVTEIKAKHPDKDVEVESAVASILGAESYSKLINPNQAKQLIQLVKKYQDPKNKNPNNANGKIDINDNIYNRLKYDIYEKLGIANLYNIDSLNALVNEIHKKHPAESKSEVRVQTALAKILSKDTKLYEELIDPTQVKQLTDLVKNYQNPKEPNNADGQIDINGNTYNRLKCDVAEELNIKLNPRTQCPTR